MNYDTEDQEMKRLTLDEYNKLVEVCKNYESFEDEEKGELLPKISVLSTQKRTEANRKITSQNRPQSTATIQVRQNGPRVNGAIINGLINEEEFKTVPQSSYKPNKSNSLDEDDGIVFGTILVNHKKKK